VVLDGSGNDTYFWKPPRPFDLAKLHLGWNRLPGLRRLRRALPMHLRYERLLSTPLELLLFPGPYLRHCDTRAFYSASADTHSSWLALFNQLIIPVEEVRSSIRSAFLGPAAHMLKARNAGMFVGALARFPWTDHEVADHCFNLPADHRFDRASGRNKVIVREMLSRFVDYDDRAIGKRVFKFDKRRFIERHLDFCRNEILSCKLWEPAIKRALADLIRAFVRGARTENALLTLLMASLWHNHWVTGSLPAMLGRPQSGSVAA
jgi:hypothetical protein